MLTGVSKVALKQIIFSYGFQAPVLFQEPLAIYAEDDNNHKSGLTYVCVPRMILCTE